MSGRPPPPPEPHVVVPARPDSGPAPKVPGSAVVKMAIGFGLALLVAVGLPRVSQGGAGTPPIGILVASGALITALTTGALWLAIRTDLRLPAMVGIYAVVYNALIVLVKFVLAPLGVYQVNRSVPLESFLPFTQFFGAATTTAIVFLLYLGVYGLMYRLFRRRLAGIEPLPRKRRLSAGGLALPLVGGAVLFAGTGGAFLIIPLLVAGSGIQYLHFVFSSGVALAIVIVLATASVLAGLAFRSMAERAELVGNASVMVSFFWLGLYFLALYHVLWLIYVLVLFSLWPLKVVIPK